MGDDFKWLDAAAIQDLWKAVINAHLSRDALLTGLSSAFRAMMPVHAAPGQQILADLQYLNEIDEAEDGSVPLRSWLETALLLSGPRKESRTFKQALEKMTIKSNPPAQVSGGAASASSGSRKPIWQSGSASELWQHPDAAVLVGVMKHYSSPQELRQIAAQAGFDTSLVHWGQSLEQCARELVQGAFNAARLLAVINEMHGDRRIAKWHSELQAILDRSK